MRKALGFALAFISGTGFGAILAWETSKEKIRVEVEKQTASLFTASTEAERLREEREAREFSVEAAAEHAEIVTRYQVEPVEPNTGIHHISDLDFESDEGFDKCIVEIFFTDDLPVFLINGVQTEDWYDHLGPTIVLTGDESMDNETFYVRNHILKMDYEVTWGKP